MSLRPMTLRFPHADHDTAGGGFLIRGIVINRAAAGTGKPQVTAVHRGHADAEARAFLCCVLVWVAVVVARQIIAKVEENNCN